MPVYNPAPPPPPAAAALGQTGQPSLPAGAQLAAARSVADLSALASDWQGLEAANPTSVFQSYDWAQAWAETVMGRDGENCEPLILHGRTADGRLVFLWPLMRCRSRGITLLRWFSEPYAQYGDVLCAADQSVAAWMAASLSLLRRQRLGDLVHLRHVRADAQAHPFLSVGFSSGHLKEGAPRLDLRLYADEAAYEARYTGQQRKRRKKIRKGLEDALGPVQFSRLAAGPEADAALDQAIAEKNAWLEERGRQNRIMNAPPHAAFLKRLLARQGSTLETVLSALTAGGKPVSWELGFRHQGSHYAYLTSHMNALTDLSPGRLHMDQSQRLCLADGQTVFDLMVPYDPHKESWSSVTTPVDDFYLGLNARGQAFGSLYLGLLRPLLRRAYYAMPANLLRRLKPITGH